MLLKSLSYAAFGLALFASTALAGEIVLNSDQSDPAPKKAMEGLIADFEKANPDIKVKWNNFAVIWRSRHKRKAAARTT